LISWVFPGGALFLGAAAFALFYSDTPLLLEMTVGYPWVVYGASVVLALLFHRSRVMAAVVIMAVADQILTSGDPARQHDLLLAIAFSLPLAYALLSLLIDRGVLTVAGGLQLGAALALMPGLPLTVIALTEPGTGFLYASPLPEWALGWSGLGQPATLSMLTSFGLTLGMGIRRQRAVERGLVWSLPAVIAALHLVPGSPASTLFLMAGGLILGFSVLETSYAMAYHDDLTGLPARRALGRDMVGLGSVFAVAMVDVDHFKRFNDRHGHDVGDQVLRMVAGQLAGVQGGGKTYRYGGEEFTVLFPGKSRDEVIFFLEEIRTAVGDARFAVRGKGRPKERPEGSEKRDGPKVVTKRLSVTVSIGVADSMGKEPTPDAVLKMADKALYRAKKGGRNRVSK
jgi:GGDEF domain-containing protein